MNESIARLLEALHLRPDGVFLGSFGAAFSLFFRAVGISSWRQGVLIVLSGSILSGYLMPAIEDATDWGAGMVSAVAFLAGVIAKDMFTAFTKYGPLISENLIRWKLPGGITRKKNDDDNPATPQ